MMKINRNNKIIEKLFTQIYGDRSFIWAISVIVILGVGLLGYLEYGRIEINGNTNMPTMFIAPAKKESVNFRVPNIITNATTEESLAGFETRDVSDVSFWKTYVNEKYGFKISYPAEIFDFETGEDFTREGFFIKRGGFGISIFPSGEFDKGLPFEEGVVSDLNFGGVSAQKIEWRESKFTMIKILEKRKNWDLEHGRIEILYGDNPEIIEKILDTFKFVQ
jgi:hypothetical protein